jgi:hypothetical protein
MVVKRLLVGVAGFGVHCEIDQHIDGDALSFVLLQDGVALPDVFSSAGEAREKVQDMFGYHTVKEWHAVTS